MAVKVVLSKKKKKTRARKQRAAPKPQELTRLGSALRSLGGLGGGALGALIGMPSSGSQVGTSLGAALSRWLGSGDYTVSSNSIVTRTLKSTDSIPAMHSSNQSVVVRHREYLGEIRSSVSFKVQQSYPLNPGSAATFPWLSRIAGNFQEYHLRGLVFHYIPSSGNAVSSTNAALGTVILSTSYRATDVPPDSKIEMLNEYCTCEAVPSEAFCHPVECDPKENPFNIQYVRSGSVPSEDSRMMYDLGVTHVAVSGQQTSGNVLGDLWCTYEVEFKKPIVSSNVTSGTQAAVIDNTTVVGTNALFTSSTVNGWPVTATGNTISFPKASVGVWLLVVVIQSDSLPTLDMSGTPTLANCTFQLFPDSAAYYRTVIGSSGTSNRCFYLTQIEIQDPAVVASITLPTATSGGAAYIPSRVIAELVRAE